MDYDDGERSNRGRILPGGKIGPGAQVLSVVCWGERWKLEFHADNFWHLLISIADSNLVFSTSSPRLTRECEIALPSLTMWTTLAKNIIHLREAFKKQKQL